MNLIIRSKEDISIEIRTIDRLLNGFKKMNKKDRVKFSKNCSNLKKEVNEHLKWLKSMKDFIDPTEAKRLENRLKKINELMVIEIKTV